MSEHALSASAARLNNLNDRALGHEPPDLPTVLMSAIEAIGENGELTRRTHWPLRRSWFWKKLVGRMQT